jgi:prepilin-type N-terminal cleavage/methylation domain-containing protein
MAVACRRGYTLIELLFATGLIVVLSAVAVPPVLAQVEEVRAAAAVRYLTSRLQQARMEAITRSADVGWRFVADSTGISYAVYLDGNGNGIRTPDITAGIDRSIGGMERLSDRFAGVEFGVAADLPAIDPGGTPPGDDPIKLGVSNILTFTPLGTSSSGSLYLRGRRNAQYAIRVFGETGRIRVVRFDPGQQRWKPAW